MKSPCSASDSEQSEVEEKLPERFAIISLGAMLMNASSWLLRQEYPVISSYVCGMSLMRQITILKNCLQFRLLVANDSGRSWGWFWNWLSNAAKEEFEERSLDITQRRGCCPGWTWGELKLLGTINLLAGMRRWNSCHQIMKVSCTNVFPTGIMIGSKFKSKWSRSTSVLKMSVLQC